MAIEARRESKQEVLEAVAAAGYPLSAPQLARLHRAGVIDEPEGRSLGRKRGRVSLYPGGTASKVIRAAALADVERRLPERAWLIWWLDGGAMSRAARQFMEETAVKLDEQFSMARQLAAGQEVTVDGESFDLDRLYRAVEEGRLDGPLATARRRVGKDKMSSILKFLVEFGTGTFTGFPIDQLLQSSAPEEELVEAGLGLARARRESIADADPWLQGDLEADFSRLASLIAGLSLRAAAATDDQFLNIARFEVSTLSSTVSEAADCLDAVFGRGAFGYRDLADSLSTKAYRHQVFAMLTWSHVRRYDRGLREGMEEINACAGQVKAMSRALRTLALLRQTIPAYEVLLSPARLGAALQDPAARETYEAELTEVREKHFDEVTAVLSGEAVAL